MASKRWRAIVEQYIQDAIGFNNIVDPMDAETMLSRQHAAVVRMVKKLRNDYDGDFQAYRTACDDLLAALAMHRKGRTT